MQPVSYTHLDVYKRQILEMKLLKDKRDIFKNYLFVGELSLDGEVKGVSGTINSVILAKEKGFKGIVVPRCV